MAGLNGDTQVVVVIYPDGMGHYEVRLTESLVMVEGAAVGCLEPALLIGVASKSVCRVGASSASNCVVSVMAGDNHGS